MNYWMCKTCGTQFPLSEEAPSQCPICEDQRQYIGPNGQEWTTIETLRSNGYKNIFREHEPDLTGIGTSPRFAIGQRALLIRSEAGNVLWDCISLLDDETEAAVLARGDQRVGHAKAQAGKLDFAEDVCADELEADSWKRKALQSGRDDENIQKFAQIKLELDAADALVDAIHHGNGVVDRVLDELLLGVVERVLLDLQQQQGVPAVRGVSDRKNKTITTPNMCAQLDL